LSPTIAVVTNIDREHMDHYENMDSIRKTFVRFINKIPFYGTGILCLDNKEIQGIIPSLNKRYLTYGMASQSDLKGKELQKEKNGVSFEVVFRSNSLGRLFVGMPGEHNVLNALAAIAVGLELDLEISVVREGLKNLGILERRFQVKGVKEDIIVLDDYGHHPTEISAVLKTARESWPDRRLIVLFQPHRYTRTKVLFDRFLVSFNEADILVIAPIYSAGEDPIEEITSQALAKGTKEHGHKDVICCEKMEDIIPKLLSIVKRGDLVITLGAGDIYRIGEELLRVIDS
jgi:UDP-N-acetylmuramate--alanine ligase